MRTESSSAPRSHPKMAERIGKLTQDAVTRLYQKGVNPHGTREERMTALDVLIKADAENPTTMPCPDGMSREDFQDTIWRTQKELLDASE